MSDFLLSQLLFWPILIVGGLIAAVVAKSLHWLFATKTGQYVLVAIVVAWGIWVVWQNYPGYGPVPPHSSSVVRTG